MVIRSRILIVLILASEGGRLPIKQLYEEVKEAE